MPMHEKLPPVIRLVLHLPGMHTVVFDPTDSAFIIIDHANYQRTTLTVFFEICTTLDSAQQYIYQKFPQHFVCACLALELLENDQEWTQCLKEAAALHTGSQLRILFAVILTQCTYTHPKKLWLCFRTDLCDDLHYHLHKEYNILDPTDKQIFDLGLFLLDKILHQSNQSLKMFSLMPF
ncbi:17187_t:CDS:2 [Cetraspora pellucida]|uniref:17187_t:CDS:1 n=1 Tax=Cetraspora pellucida TaxID=1433469 RepID=A0ACA9L8Z5_9GLOM|nr:17187_t:CDS:2 [Cetraspora pellucida]